MKEKDESAILPVLPMEDSMVHCRVLAAGCLLAAALGSALVAGCSGSGRPAAGDDSSDRDSDAVRGGDLEPEGRLRREAEAGTTRQFGDPCMSDADCAAGWCIPTEAGGRCSDLCDQDCPPGWVCRPVEGDAGKSMVCLPEMARLCRPCVEDAECRVIPGVLSDHCVVYGEEGAFCGTACLGPTECPKGYVCQWMTTIGGNEVY
ncbi:MAG: hypothetical protein FJ109_19315, partial [Deltaproteobacteria bacterium]|nr:hypothetical protein [Deltaproteobacteria bacterium]